MLTYGTILLRLWNIVTILQWIHVPMPDLLYIGER